MGVGAWLTDPANWSGPNGIPVRTWQQIIMSLLAMAIALAIALPLGLLLGHLRRGTLVATNISNVGRAVPTLAVLIIVASIPAVGVGDAAAVLALAVFAIPPLVTNTFTGMASIDPELQDAGSGMGMGRRQRVLRIEVPLATPLIAAGIRTTSVQVVATASLAALVGGGGLGRYVVDGFALQDTTLIVAGALLTALLAVVAEGVLALLERAATPRGLRQRPAQARAIADTVG
ncbi:MAG TPA: ABC transporter permease subunit [Candidatus Nanopelagicales bacterium]